jgi:hypothetical protein
METRLASNPDIYAGCKGARQIRGQNNPRGEAADSIH